MNRKTKILVGASIAVFVASLTYVKKRTSCCKKTEADNRPANNPVCEGVYSWVKHDDVYVCTYNDGVNAGVGKSTHLETAKKLSLINAMRNKS